MRVSDVLQTLWAKRLEEKRIHSFDVKSASLLRLGWLLLSRLNHCFVFELFWVDRDYLVALLVAEDTTSVCCRRWLTMLTLVLRRVEQRGARLYCDAAQECLQGPRRHSHILDDFIKGCTLRDES